MAPIDPRLVIHNRVNTKASLVTKDAARIYGSQWKTKLIEGKVTKVDKRIPEGKSRSATYIEVDWELPGRVIRKELNSRVVVRVKEHFQYSETRF